MFYIYILKSQKDQKLYIGFTSNLQERLRAHNLGQSKTTKIRIPFDLIYYEVYRSKKDAIIRENKLKKFKNSYQRLKERIVNSLNEN